MARAEPTPGLCALTERGERTYPHITYRLPMARTAGWLASALLCVRVGRIHGQDCQTGNAYDEQVGEGQCAALIAAGIAACDPDFSFGGEYQA